MLTEVAPDIWIADGPSVPFFGFKYPTRMTVVRLSDKSLWVWSPIQLSEELRAAIVEQGSVRFLVSPNKIHHLHLSQWAQAWAKARLYASPDLARRRRDLSFYAELGEVPDPAWRNDIDQVIMRGSFAMDEVVLFHVGSRTAIVADLVQRWGVKLSPLLQADLTSRAAASILLLAKLSTSVGELLDSSGYTPPQEIGGGLRASPSRHSAGTRGRAYRAPPGRGHPAQDESLDNETSNS